MNRKHIELSGLPGTGKTTLLNDKTFDNYFKMEDYIKIIKNYNNFAKLRKLLLSFIIFPKPIIFLFLYLFNEKKNIREMVTIFKSYFYFVTNIYYITQKTDKLVVLDQGLVQMYWSLFSHNSSATINKNLLRVIKYTDLKFEYFCIHLCIDPLIASSRAGTRNSSLSYDQMSKKERDNTYKKRSKDFNSIFKIINSKNVIVLSEEVRWLEDLSIIIHEFV